MPGRARTVVCEKCGGRLVLGSLFCNLCGTPVTTGRPAAGEGRATARIGAGMLLEGKWRVDEQIGEGSMGTVFRCTDVALDRTVAIKVLAAELCVDPVFVARFEREARLTANLEHPNVVLIYGVGRHAGRPFIVMKWIAGETLASRLDAAEAAGTRMPAADVRSLVAQVCSGLGYIHERALVHRDIKDSNIVVDAHGRATILDFGILRDLTSDEQLTQAGFVMGTPAYIAPELIAGKRADRRSDLYAVGVLLYQMLTGALPYDAESEHELVRKHVEEPPPDPCRRNPFLPAAVGRLLQKAIDKDPDRRFQDAGELAREFESAFADPVEVTEKMRPKDLVSAEADRPTRVERAPATRPPRAADGDRDERPTNPDGAPTDPALTWAVTRPVTRPLPRPWPGSRRGLWEGMALGLLAAVLAYTVFFYSLGAKLRWPTWGPIAPDAPRTAVAAPDTDADAEETAPDSGEEAPDAGETAPDAGETTTERG